jgi:Kef-type K+ transport system membrane component KefB
MFVGMRLYPLLSPYLSSREAKGFTFSLIMALLFGLLAELAGLHLILGAYMAGLFVREEIMHKELFRKIQDRFVSITYGFLGPIFFVSLAFHITFGIFRTHLALVLLLLAVAVLGKLLGALLGARAGGMNTQESAIVAWAMNGRGAVELVIAAIGLSAGIIDDTLFSVLVVIAFLTTFIPPLSLSLLLRGPVRRKDLLPAG